jgi:DNA-binding NarL/FixJ family response regulator
MVDSPSSSRRHPVPRSQRRLARTRGETFVTVRRPRCKRDKQASPRITVALADQQHLIREGIRSLLEAEKDLKVVGEVADGLKVVGLVERRKPQVLIMALAMPGLNCFEVTLRVRRRSPQTAVILLSMYAGDRYVIEALRSGASGYVVTEARGIELIRAIRKVVAGGRYLSAPLSERRLDTWLRQAKARTLEPYDPLTSREREVFHLVAEGHSNDNIAGRLSISRRTTESHRANIMRKLHLSNQIDLVRFAIARGILASPLPFLRFSRRGRGGQRRTESRVFPTRPTP